MMNTKINNYFAQKAQREEAAKKAELAAMVEAVGIDEVLSTMLAHLSEINKTIAEVETEEDERFNEAKRTISVDKYNNVRTPEGKHRPVSFSEKTERVYLKALKTVGVVEKAYKDGTSSSGKVAHSGFAKFVVEASGNKGDTLVDIINILRDASWDGGRGITRQKMEMLYHVLILHRDKREEVIAILTRLLKDYDKTSLMVTANQCEEYRNHLKYEEKMTLFLEDEVCKQIGEQPLFARETQTA